MRKFYAFITVIVVLSLLVTACGSRRPGPVLIQLGPRISDVDVPTGLNAGATFTFSVTTTGPEVVAWDWDFGGGADPDTSTAEMPVVILVNPSTVDDVTYTGTVTVWDADNRSDEMEFDFVVGRTLNRAPEFVGTPTFTASATANTATVEFTINDEDGEDVTITLVLTAADGVDISDTEILATAADYGPFMVTITNNTFGDENATVDITLDDGTDVVDLDPPVEGVVPGIVADPDSIIVVAPSDVTVGEAFGVTVFLSDVANAVGYFDSIEVDYGGLTPDETSWNLGAAGGGEWDKDGSFWEAYPDTLFTFGTGIFWAGANLAVNCSPLGTPVTGAPAGTSGPLFYAEFTADAAGTYDVLFVHDGTHYLEPDGSTSHYFTNEVGATITAS